MKHFIRLLLCLTLVFGLALPVSAGEVDGTVVVTGEEPSAPSTTVTQPPATECSHTYDGGTVTTAATCVTAGVKTFACTKCGGGSYTEAIPATGVHSYGPWVGSNGTHTRTCTGCPATESGACTYDGGSVNQSPTCSAAGNRVYTCSACNGIKNEPIAIDPNAHTFGAWNGGQEGVHTRACTGCGKSESSAHVWDVTATIPATCLEEGATAYGCSTCERIEYEIIPKLTTHTYDNVCDPDCNVCGATRVTEHTYSKTWSKNAKGHWHACTKCGAQTDNGSHYPGPAATEEKAQICLTCGYTLTAKLNHTHKYASAWTSDETGHWYACEGCDEEKDFSEHSYDDACDPDCNICGYRTATAHSFDGTWTSDETGHWGKCTVCGEEGDPVPHTPGPEATEEEAQVCEICGFEIAPALEHEHTFQEPWLSDAENHWQACECEELSDPVPHTWDEGTEDKEAGTMVFTCTECGETRSEALPEPESGFPWWIVIVILLLGVIGAAVALVVVLKKGKGKFTN